MFDLKSRGSHNKENTVVKISPVFVVGERLKFNIYQASGMQHSLVVQ